MPIIVTLSGSSIAASTLISRAMRAGLFVRINGVTKTVTLT